MAVTIICVPVGNEAVQVPGQLMPVGLVVTCPCPLPESVTVSCALAGGGGGAGLSVTAILVLVLTANVHVELVPWHPPPFHPANTMSGSGTTVSLTRLPAATEILQAPLAPVWQEMPEGLLRTAPVPVPWKATLTWNSEGEGAGELGLLPELLLTPPQEQSSKPNPQVTKSRRRMGSLQLLEGNSRLNFFGIP